MPTSSTTASNVQGQLHVDGYLTDFSLSWEQAQSNFVATQAASIIPVQKASDKYVSWDRGYFWRDEAQARPLGGRPKRVGKKFSSDNYNCEEYALEDVIDDRQRANADAPVRLEENTIRNLTQKHKIKQDRTWASTFFGTGIWTTEYTGVSSNPGTNEFIQFDDANSDPIDVIDRVKDTIAENTGFMPNTMILGADVKRALRSNADLSDRIKYTQTGVLTNELMASLFDVDRVVSARSIYNAADEGLTDDFQFIADSTAFWMGYIDPNAGLESPTAIALFAWNGYLPNGGVNERGGVVERGRDDAAHSDYFQVRQAWDMKLVSQDLGAFFGNAVRGRTASA